MDTVMQIGVCAFQKEYINRFMYSSTLGGSCTLGSTCIKST